MAGEVEVDRMVVRLMGDGSNYRKMMSEAKQTTEEVSRGIEGRLRDSRGRFLTGQKLMQAELRQTSSAFARLGIRARFLGESLESAGKKTTAFGRTLRTKVTLPLTIMAGVSVKAFADFDQAMTKSTSIMELVGDEAERMKETALDLSRETIQSPKDLADSYFFLASAGKSAEQSMALLPKVAEFATAGAFNMALATDLLTDAQSALGLTSEDVAEDLENLVRVSDVLVKANTLANASVQQFSEAITSDAGASMKAFNIDMQEGVAVLAAFADQGLKASEGGSAFGRMIRLLAKGALENADIFQELGIQVFNTENEFNNMADIIGQMEVAFKGMGPEVKTARLQQLGFSALAQKAILPLLGTSEAIREYESGLRDLKDVTQEIAKKQLQSFINQMLIVKNAVTRVAIEVGGILAPTLTKIGKIVAEWTLRWESLTDKQKKMIVTIAGIVAAVGPLALILGPLTTKIGGLIKLFSLLRIAMIQTGIGAIVVGIGALAAVLLTSEDAMREVQSALEPFKEVWKEIEKLWKEIKPDVIELAKVIGSELKNAFESMVPVIKTTIKLFSDYLITVVKAVSETAKLIKQASELKLSGAGTPGVEGGGGPGIGSLAKGFLGPLSLLGLGGGEEDRPGKSIKRSGKSFGSKKDVDEVNAALKERQRILEETEQISARERAQEEIDALEAIKKQNEEKRKLAEREKQQAENIKNTIKALEEQAKTYGFNRKELALYNAEQNNASPAQKTLIANLHDGIEAMEEDTKSKAEAKKATEEATKATEREIKKSAQKEKSAQERFQRSIKGFGVQAVGRGIESLARIEESRRLRGTGQGPASKEDQALKELKMINASTAATAEKPVLEVKPAKISST